MVSTIVSIINTGTPSFSSWPRKVAGGTNGTSPRERPYQPELFGKPMTRSNEESYQAVPFSAGAQILRHGLRTTNASKFQLVQFRYTHTCNALSNKTDVK